MAKPDWGALQNQFLAEHAKSGISPKDWCEAQGLNYASAKRYIKVTNYGANSQKGTAKKSANSQKHNTAQKGRKPKETTNCESPKSANSGGAKPERRKRWGVNNHPPFESGNQHALKHGGYGRRMLLSDAVTEDAHALTLDDELFWLRAANLTAAENIGHWQAELELATDGDLVVEHNRQDLPWLTVIAAFERSVGTYGASMYICVNDDKGTTREKLSAIAARYMVGEATESTEELVSEVMDLFDKYETRRLIDSCIRFWAKQNHLFSRCRPTLTSCFLCSHGRTI